MSTVDIEARKNCNITGTTARYSDFIRMNRSCYVHMDENAGLVPILINVEIMLCAQG